MMIIKESVLSCKINLNSVKSGSVLGAKLPLSWALKTCIVEE